MFLLQNVSDDGIQCFEHYSRDCYSNPDLLGCHCAARCILRFGAGTVYDFASFYF